VPVEPSTVLMAFWMAAESSVVPSPLAPKSLTLRYTRYLEFVVPVLMPLCLIFSYQYPPVSRSARGLAITARLAARPIRTVRGRMIGWCSRGEQICNLCYKMKNLKLIDHHLRAVLYLSCFLQSLQVSRQRQRHLN